MRKASDTGSRPGPFLNEMRVADAESMREDLTDAIQ